MRISTEMEQRLNDMFHEELRSSNLYLAMASFFIDQELKGLGNFFLVQAEEEHFHAMKHFHYLHQVGGKLTARDIPAPSFQGKTPLDIFAEALAHEKKVTQAIYDLIDKALSQKDFATYTFLEWFVKEQVEEEMLFNELVAKLKMIGADKPSLFFLNEELGKRTFAPPKGE